MAPPPGSRALRPVLAEDDLLAGRYRLVRPVPLASPEDSGPAVLWLAHDEVLARPVAAKVLPAGGKRGAAAARPFLEAAAASGSLAHPVLARVYDAAVEERPAERAGRAAGEIDVAYVISEWVDGPSLARSLLEDGPYDAPDAAELVEQLAEALAVAHAAGLHHGRLHPGNVLLTSAGAVRLTDLGTSVVLPQRAVPAQRADDPPPAAADVRDLAAVLYAALTARWPATATPQPSGGLPPAPAGREQGRHRGRLTSPRQVRAGVPRALDAVVVRALDPRTAGDAPALTTATGLSAATRGSVRTETPVGAVPEAPRRPRVPRWVRKVVPPLLVLGALVALGVTTYSLGKDVGTVDALDVRASAPSPGVVAPSPAVRLSADELVVRDFDPAGGDGERPGEVGNATDGDPGTAWTTERYDGATFGGLKDGVGLLVDLGGTTPLGRVELELAAPGTLVELRGGDVAGEDAAAYPVLASGTSADGPLVLTPPRATSVRFALVWITRLPQVDGRFVAGVEELRLFRP